MLQNHYQPIFIVGSRRSGSNLLRLMLNQLPGIAAPHPPHIIHKMIPVLGNYGDLNLKKNFTLLVNDVCELVNNNPVPWQTGHFDTAKVLAECKAFDLLEIFKVIYESAARQKGATAWCCKSMEVGYHLDAVASYFPNAKYIYLYRDGRDVAVSTNKAPLGEKHFYFIAKRWVEEQQNVLSFEKKRSGASIFKLCYEDLVHHPEKAGREVSAFLNQDYSKKMLYFYKSSEAIATASSGSLWGNVVKQVMKGNTEKFKTEAPQKMVEVFENVAGEMLDELGYSRWLIQRGAEVRYSPAEIAEFGKASKQMPV